MFGIVPNAVLGEGSKLRTDWVRNWVRNWVRKKLQDLLNSKTTKVIDDLIQLRANPSCVK